MTDRPVNQRRAQFVMPRSPKDNQEIRDARREELLAAAARVFVEKGYAEAKIADIAAAAGLSHGLVYHYFDSKEAIFGAMVDAMMARIDDDLASVADLPAIERIVSSLERSRRRCTDPVDANRTVVQAMLQGHVPPSISDRLRDHLHRKFKQTVEWIEAAQQEGDVMNDVEAPELASALMCLVRGMLIRSPHMPELPFAIPRTQTIVRLLGALPARSKAGGEASGTHGKEKSGSTSKDGDRTRKTARTKSAARTRRA